MTDKDTINRLTDAVHDLTIERDRLRELLDSTTAQLHATQKQRDHAKEKCEALTDVVLEGKRAKQLASLLRSDLDRWQAAIRTLLEYATTALEDDGHKLYETLLYAATEDGIDLGRAYRMAKGGNLEEAEKALNIGGKEEKP